MTVDVVTVLKRAKEHVEKGWCQHMSTTADDQVCAGMALQMAIHEELDRVDHVASIEEDEIGIYYGFAATPLLEAARALTLADYYDNIPRWNDGPDRTKDQVLDTFDMAIKIAERDIA